MRLIEAMDNSVVFAFLGIMCFLLYIVWNILKTIMLKVQREVQDPYDLNQNNSNLSDPYANSGPHEECSICTERIKYKVELDCSHSFCGKCIMDYYETIRPSILKCPLCRNQIRIINSENLVRDNNTRNFYDNIVRYNHRQVNGWNFYGGYFLDFSYIFYRGICNIFNDGLLLFYFIIGLGVVIYYVLSPYDIIPDTLGLIGYIDDISIMGCLTLWVMNRFYARFRDRVEAEYEQIMAQ